jgi:hypothetical protein
MISRAPQTKHWGRLIQLIKKSVNVLRNVHYLRYHSQGSVFGDKFHGEFCWTLRETQCSRRTVMLHTTYSRQSSDPYNTFMLHTGYSLRSSDPYNISCCTQEMTIITLSCCTQDTRLKAMTVMYWIFFVFPPISQEFNFSWRFISRNYTLSWILLIEEDFFKEKTSMERVKMNDQRKSSICIHKKRFCFMFRIQFR